MESEMKGNKIDALNSKMKEAQKRIEERANQKVKEMEQETERQIKEFLEKLKHTKGGYELDKLIDEHIREYGYSAEHTLLDDARVKDALLKKYIAEYPLKSNMEKDTKDRIADISYAVFETGFNTIPDRLHIGKDEKIRKKASKMLLKMAEEKQDIDIMIPLKHYLKIDNSAEVRRKLDYLMGMNTNDREFSNNSVNAIYRYEQLLKWVDNDAQRKEIIDRIVELSKARIKNNIKAVADKEKEIRKKKREMPARKREIEDRIKALEEQNNPKIEQINKKIEEHESKSTEIMDERNKIYHRLTDLGYNTLHRQARDDLNEGKVREAMKVIKDKEKVRRMRDLIKQDNQLSKRDYAITKKVRELKNQIYKLQYPIANEKRELNYTIEKFDKFMEDATREIRYCSSRILDAILKIGSYNREGDIEKGNYYKYLEIVLDNAESDSEIKQIKDVMPIIKKITEG